MSILGQPSIAELKDLLAAKDYTIAQLGKSYDDFVGQWVAKDIAAQTDWFADWNNLLARYGEAKKHAEAEITAAKLSPVPDTTIAAPNGWNDVVAALKQNPDTITKGDLQDLHDRLAAAGKQTSYPNVPQPKPGSDTDLNLFKAADVVTSSLSSTAKAALPWVLIVVGGALFILIWTLGKVAPVAVPMATGGALRVKSNSEDWESKWLAMRRSRKV